MSLYLPVCLRCIHKRIATFWQPSGAFSDRFSEEYNSNMDGTIQGQDQAAGAAALVDATGHRDPMQFLIESMQNMRAENQAQLQQIGAEMSSLSSWAATQEQNTLRLNRHAEETQAALQAVQHAQQNAIPLSGQTYQSSAYPDRVLYNRPMPVPAMSATSYGAKVTESYGLISHMSEKNVQELRKAWPVYSRKEPFFAYSLVVNMAANSFGVDLAAQENSRHLKEMQWMKIDETVRVSISSLCPVYFPTGNFTDYLKVLETHFDPPAMSSEVLQAYKRRKQAPNEDVRSYLGDKWMLYQRSHPNWQLAGFEEVREDILAGLVHPVVYDKACDANCVNYESLKATVVNITASEQMKHRQGRGTSTADGLSVARGYIEVGKDGKKTYSVNQVHVEEEQVVNQIQENRQPTVQYSRNRNFGQNRRRNGSGANRAVNSGRQRRPCFDCGATDHFMNSPKCPSPGAFKFLPKGMEYMKKRSRVATVNQVTEERLEVPVEPEVSFLDTAKTGQSPK